MSEDPEYQPLGYDREGKAIYPPRAGMIYTQCVITCRDCHVIISGMGGPMHGAQCLNCNKPPSREIDFGDFGLLGQDPKYIAQSAAGIIQNPGVIVTEVEIENWRLESIQAMENFVAKYRAHVDRVARNLKHGRYTQ